MKFNKPLFAMAAVISGSLTSCGLASNPFTRHSSNGGGNSTPPSSQIAYQSQMDPRPDGDCPHILIDVPIYYLDFADRHLAELYPHLLAEYGDFTYSLSSTHVSEPESEADIMLIDQTMCQTYFESGLISVIDEEWANATVEENIKAAMAPALLDDGRAVAYPLAANNGFCLIYDTSYLTEDDVLEWRSLLDKAESIGKKVCWGVTEAWYSFPLLSSFGCVSEWRINVEGRVLSYNDNVVDHGLAALQLLHDLGQSPALIKDSYIEPHAESGEAIAVVTGVWEFERLSSLFRENMAVATLPFADSIPTRTFFGGVYLAINEKSASKDIANRIAWELTNVKAQNERVEEDDGLSFIPSCYESRLIMQEQDPRFVGFFAQQENYWVNQGAYPGGWWDAMGQLLSGVIKLPSPVRDEDIEQLLQTYDNALLEMLN